MVTIVIPESPAKCKKLEQYLGKGYKCIPSYGHVADLAEGMKAIKPKGSSTFSPEWKTQGAYAWKQLSLLRSWKKKATEFIIATDDDREGEAIGYHLCRLLDLPLSKTKRIVFHEITKDAIQEAMKHPTTIDMKKVDAQIARRVLDRLIGYSVTPIVKNYVNRQLTAGRVQSPAVLLVDEREALIESHTSTSSWGVSADIVWQKCPLSIRAQDLDKNGPKKQDESHIQMWIKKLDKQPFELNDIEETEEKKYPMGVLTTSTMQQMASQKLFMSPSQTMKCAQQLYEGGYITYMRTDSKHIAPGFVKQAIEHITTSFGSSLVGSKYRDFKTSARGSSRSSKTGKHAQQAHEAIRPTNVKTKTISAKGISHDARRLYRMIYNITLASFMTPAVYDKWTTLWVHPAASKVLWKGVTKHRKVDGYMILFSSKTEAHITDELSVSPPTNDDESCSVAFLNLMKQDNFDDVVGTWHSIEAIQHFSSPPGRFTEAMLIKQLEKSGVGRPSTYSSTIKAIQDHGYVVKKDIDGVARKRTRFIKTRSSSSVKKECDTIHVGQEKGRLTMTPYGRKGAAFLLSNFSDVLSPEFTSTMEDNLDKIASKNMAWDKYVSSVDAQLTPLLQNVKKTATKEVQSKELFSTDDGNYQYTVTRYGPAVVRVSGSGRVYKSLKKELDLYTHEELEDLFEYPKTLGTMDGNEIVVNDGKYGYYLSCAGTNVSLLDPDITLEEAISKLKEKNATVIASFSKGLTIQKGKGDKGNYMKMGRRIASLQSIPESTYKKWSDKEAHAYFAEKSTFLRSFGKRKS